MPESPESGRPEIIEKEKAPSNAEELGERPAKIREGLRLHLPNMVLSPDYGKSRHIYLDGGHTPDEYLAACGCHGCRSKIKERPVEE